MVIMLWTPAIATFSHLFPYSTLTFSESDCFLEECLWSLVFLLRSPSALTFQNPIMVSIMNACDAFLYYDCASFGVPFYHGSYPSLYLLQQICESWPFEWGCSWHGQGLLVLAGESKGEDRNGVSSKRHWKSEACPRIRLQGQTTAGQKRMARCCCCCCWWCCREWILQEPWTQLQPPLRWNCHWSCQLLIPNHKEIPTFPASGQDQLAPGEDETQNAHAHLESTSSVRSGASA